MLVLQSAESDSKLGSGRPGRGELGVSEHGLRWLGEPLHYLARSVCPVSVKGAVHPPPRPPTGVEGLFGDENETSTHGGMSGAYVWPVSTLDHYHRRHHPVKKVTNVHQDDQRPPSLFSQPFAKARGPDCLASLPQSCLAYCCWPHESCLVCCSNLRPVARSSAFALLAASWELLSGLMTRMATKAPRR